jgi:hypothetical protein
MGCPSKKSRAMRKGFFIYALCILLFETSPLSAQWWNPFAPKDYEDCAEGAARDAKSKAALDILLEACDNKFKGRRKLGGGYTYFDPRQNRNFDIAGPNPTKREVEVIDKQYEAYLEQQRRAAAAVAEREEQQRILDADAERRRRLTLADQQRRTQQAALELAQRRKTAGQYIDVVSANIECPYSNSISQCGTYSFTVRLRNRSHETISRVSVGWVFMPEGQSGCPTSYQTKYQQTVTLRPGDTTVLNIDSRWDGPAGPFRYCVSLTDVDIVP